MRPRRGQAAVRLWGRSKLSPTFPRFPHSLRRLVAGFPLYPMTQLLGRLALGGAQLGLLVAAPDAAR